MQDINTAFDYIPDESNDSIIYMKDPTPISIGVKPVKFSEEDTEENKMLQTQKDCFYLSNICKIDVWICFVEKQNLGRYFVSIWK